ncbi:hypothetical protein DNTS_007916 [Danionella cerebrum]|uniref:Uncharacterized protein n=1 Tax=Danionella cerebrum TaxID=2873325 RepID=A0A553RBR3_9TELE|nr:hypothetical protein DNTS_007916 [Danionella translucida]
MKNHSSSSRLNNHSSSHSLDRSSRKELCSSVFRLRFSLRDYAFCMATLLLFCLGSLFYQLNGGPPKVLLEIRQYLDPALRWFLHVFFNDVFRQVCDSASSPLRKLV